MPVVTRAEGGGWVEGFSGIMYLVYEATVGSKLQPHQLLVCGDRFVAKGQHHLKSQICLFRLQSSLCGHRFPALTADR